MKTMKELKAKTYSNYSNTYLNIIFIFPTFFPKKIFKSN